MKKETITQRIDRLEKYANDIHDYLVDKEIKKIQDHDERVEIWSLLFTGAVIWAIITVWIYMLFGE